MWEQHVIIVVVIVITTFFKLKCTVWYVQTVLCRSFESALISLNFAGKMRNISGHDYNVLESQNVLCPTLFFNTV